jgi:putative addiction module component (TIGR02574 family)
MTQAAKKISKDALSLSPEDRAAVAEEIRSSLESAEDPAIEAAWAREADSRIAAYERGELKARPADEVFAEFSAGT